jgi:hypothetical protein
VGSPDPDDFRAGAVGSPDPYDFRANQYYVEADPYDVLAKLV